MTCRRANERSCEVRSKPGGRPCGFDDVPEVGCVGVVGRKGALDFRRVGKDDGQQIVEVVRNPAGKTPNGLHLFRFS